LISKSLFKRASVFLTGTVIAKGLGAVSGLLLARWLEVEDFALYIIIIIVMGAIGVLTKGGVHLSFTAIMGREWPNMSKISKTIGSLIVVRRLVSMVMLPLILLLTGFMLYENNASLLQIIVISIALLLFWWADLQTAVVDQVLFFAHETTKVQVLDTVLAVLRLTLIAITFVIGELNIITVTLISVAMALFRVNPIMKWVNSHFESNQHIENESYTKEMKHCVKHQMPVDIYMVLQAQVILLMLTYFAGSAQIAEYGALNRLLALFAPINAFVYAFCVPIFNRKIVNSGKVLLFMLAVTSIPGVLVVIIANNFPDILLWLIGENYNHLEKELLVASLVFLFSSIVGTFWTLLAHKGMYRWTLLQIPIGVVWFILAIWVLDLSKVTDAFILQGGFSISLLTVALMGYFFRTNKATTP
jgi:O-antigen/teichoic acid export membrane protein